MRAVKLAEPVRQVSCCPVVLLSCCPVVLGQFAKKMLLFMYIYNALLVQKRLPSVQTNFLTSELPELVLPHSVSRNLLSS